MDHRSADGELGPRGAAYANSGDTWRVTYRNLSIGSDVDVELRLTRASACAFTVSYSRSIKRLTRFTIAPAPMGSTLTIVEDYASVAREQAEREADRSLHAWGVALNEYLKRHARWCWCAPWRWYMRRVWTPMKPSARRITYIILETAVDRSRCYQPLDGLIVFHAINDTRLVTALRGGSHGSGGAWLRCNSLEWNNHSASSRLALHPHNRTLHPVQLPFLGLFCSSRSPNSRCSRWQWRCGGPSTGCDLRALIHAVAANVCYDARSITKRGM